MSSRWIAARILGGNDTTPEGRSFMERYRVQGYPALMALTAEGEVVDGDLLKGKIRTAPELVRAMEAAEDEAKMFTKVRDDLLAKDDVESLEELAKRYLARGNGKRAVATYALAVAKNPSADTYEQLAAWASSNALADEEEDALDHLLATWPDHERRMTWRIRRALVGIPSRGRPAEMPRLIQRNVEALEKLRAEVEAEGSTADEADVRLARAFTFRESGSREDAEVDLDWILANASTAPAALLAHLMKARDAVRGGEFAGAREHATKILDAAEKGSDPSLAAHRLLADLAYSEGDLEGALAEYRAIVEEAPESRAAEGARQAIPALEEELAEDAPHEDTDEMGD